QDHVIDADPQSLRFIGEKALAVDLIKRGVRITLFAALVNDDRLVEADGKALISGDGRAKGKRLRGDDQDSDGENAGDDAHDRRADAIQQDGEAHVAGDGFVEADAEKSVGDGKE